MNFKVKNYFDKQLAISVCKGKLARSIQTHTHLVYLLKSFKDCAKLLGVTQQLEDHDITGSVVKIACSKVAQLQTAAIFCEGCDILAENSQSVFGPSAALKFLGYQQKAPELPQAFWVEFQNLAAYVVPSNAVVPCMQPQHKESVMTPTKRRSEYESPQASSTSLESTFVA